jgi:fatty-acyl-CoA synthase
VLMPNGIGYWIERWARIDPERVAVVYEGAETTRGELYDRVDALGGYLESRGLRPDDRVALLMENHPDFFVAFWAIVRAGAVFVPLSPRLSAAEQATILDAASPDLIITQGSLAHDGLTAKAAVVVLDAPEVAQELTSGRHSARPVDLPLDTPLAILFTSGTTGRPKGVVISHGAVMLSSLDLIIGFGLSTADTHLITLPLCYTGGLISSSMLAFHTGARIILERKFEAGRALELLESEQATVMLGVPTMYQMMRDDERFEDADWSSLRLACCGGAPAAPELTSAYRVKGITLVHPYGITEAAGSSTVLTSAEAREHPGSAGRPGLYCEVEVHDQDGALCPPGTVGEIAMAGPQLMAEYLDDPQATAEAMKGRWFSTGDLGYQDESGWLHIAGRAKDMVITGGFNVYPVEVENVVSELPWVSECAVLGMPDSHWGEVLIVALIASEPGHRGEDVQEHCRARIAAYKVPKNVCFVDTLPKGESGKVLKRQLRIQLEAASKERT